MELLILPILIVLIVFSIIGATMIILNITEHMENKHKAESSAEQNENLDFIHTKTKTQHERKSHSANL